MFRSKKKNKIRKSRHNSLRVESLESREMLTAVSLTEYEQLMLELLNRARMDPLGEVARQSAVSDLNQGLSPGTISTDAKQPLASHQLLSDSASLHALDMLENNYFDHTNLIGESPSDRAANLGYSDGGGGVGENLAWNGAIGPIDYEAETIKAHNNLFFSPSHRSNLLNSPYEHAGIAVEFGDYTHTDGRTYNAAMVAHGFGFTSGNKYLTGVVFDDAVTEDDFYSIGESVEGVRITATDVSSSASFWTLSSATGGYNMQLPSGTYVVTATDGDLSVPLTVSGVTIGSDNVKVDFNTSDVPLPNQDIVGFNSIGDFWAGESNGSTLDTKYYGEFPSTAGTEIFGVGDFNGDGLDDIVGRDNSGLIRVAISTGESTFDTRVWGSFTDITTWTMVVGDFNGDGMDDILGRADSDGSVWVGLSDGNLFANSKWTTFSPEIAWPDLLVADTNGDGYDDFVGRASNGQWWVGTSSGTAFSNSHWTTWSSTATWDDVQVGDFNGDGLEDIAGRQNNKRWYVNVSTGSAFNVQHWASWTSSVVWEDVSVGDFDGDGQDDIAGRANGQWWLAMSTGSGFSNEYWGYWTTDVSWEDVKIIDINGDGRDDIIGRASNGQWWVFNSESSYFSATLATTWSPTAVWSHIAVGNFI